MSTLIKPHALLCSLILLSASLACAAAPRVLVVNIDRAGPVLVNAIKQNPSVTDWSEIGERLLLETDGKRGLILTEELQAQGRLLRTIDDTVLSQLAAVPRIHHLADGQDEHREGVDLTGAHGRWFVERANNRPGQQAIAGRQVLAYQYNNRAHAKSLSEPSLAALALQVQPERWLHTLERLASFDRESAQGFQSALGLVGQAFDELGLQVSKPSFTLPGTFPPELGVSRNFNIIGFKPGREEGVIVIGAHLDSRNATYNDFAPSPGAEDNGSGCAGVIEAARILAPMDSRLGLVFICFGLEERGLYGSYGHVASAQNSGLDIVGMINMDMIGYDGDDRLDMLMDTTSVGQSLANTLAQIAATYTDLELVVSHGLGRSDHVPYLNAFIPAALLIEDDFDIYPYYHTSSDTVDNVSPVMAGEIIKVAVLGAAKLADVSLSADAYDGHWFDPDQTGQGFHIQALDNNGVVVAWYTYDNLGAPYWLVGSGTLVDGVAEFSLSSTSGGTFPPSLQPDGISYQAWGSLRVTFSDCTHATAEWTPAEGSEFSAGSMPLTRLTASQSRTCP